MKLLGYHRNKFTAWLYIPREDTSGGSGGVALVFEKVIPLNFMGDPSKPRSVVFADEPMPVTAVLTALKNQKDEQFMYDAEWTITTTEPVLNHYNRVEAYRHQIAVRNKPNFGYLDIYRG